ncbi:MAG: DUF3149 domain-containing protein [Azonexus sp.]|jgi:hypothetical protein|nr:DUF3149 domain-containing protein [Azonexus sp.]
MAWDLLLTSDIGLMSLGVIVGVVVIGAVMVKVYTGKMNEEGSRSGK